VADDIVERLRALVVDQFYGEDQDTVAEGAAEIERLRAVADELRGDLAMKVHRIGELADELDRLRAALQLSAALLSSLHPYDHMHPEQVLTFLQSEVHT
jgi:hypothetical protein